MRNLRGGSLGRVFSFKLGRFVVAQVVRVIHSQTSSRLENLAQFLANVKCPEVGKENYRSKMHLIKNASKVSFLLVENGFF